MSYRVGQSNFSKGEVSEELLARIDIDSYGTALKRARNVIVMKYGGITKRPGTRLVAEVYADDGVRLMPFQFSLTQTYALEMGQGYMRPAALGGLVLEEKLTVQAVTLGATTQIQANFHGYAVGDQVFFDGVLGATWLNGKIGRVVSVPNVNNFIVAIVSMGKPALSGDTGGIIRVGAPPPPPPPPSVPPPSPPPSPPVIGGGGGYCVAANTLILLSDGKEVEASTLRVKMMLRTQHEQTMQWGDFAIEAISFAVEPVFECVVAGKTIFATARHRLWDGKWVFARDIGVPAGDSMVAKISVERARTYISNGVLSHNLKPNDS